MKELPTEENLREVLSRIPGAKVRRIHWREGELVAVVTAERWRGVDEGARQREVWDLLLKEFETSEQQERIDFVFTDTPEHRDAIDEKVRQFLAEKAAAAEAKAAASGATAAG